VDTLANVNCRRLRSEVDMLANMNVGDRGERRWRVEIVTMFVGGSHGIACMNVSDRRRLRSEVDRIANVNVGGGGERRSRVLIITMYVSSSDAI